MRKIRSLAVAAGALFALGFSAPALAQMPGITDSVVVVDKGTNKIHLCNYNDGKLEVVKSYRATFGKNGGDKLWEGDLKTPEGIYDFLY